MNKQTLLAISSQYNAYQSCCMVSIIGSVTDIGVEIPIFIQEYHAGQLCKADISGRSIPKHDNIYIYDNLFRVIRVEHPLWIISTPYNNNLGWLSLLTVLK